MEQWLQEAGIRRDPLGFNIQNGNKPVNSGMYSFYRYDLKTVNRKLFKAPETGDIMEFVSLHPSSPKNRWYSRDSWRVIKNYNVLDHIEKLNGQDKNELFQFLKANNIDRNLCDVTHSDGSITTGLIVSPNELAFFPALYKKEWQKEEASNKANQWYKKDTWRIINGIPILDNTGMLNDKQRIALGCFLQKNRITFNPVGLEHGDKTVTSAIEISEQPEIFFNRLQQYKTLMNRPKGKNR